MLVLQINHFLADTDPEFWTFRIERTKIKFTTPNGSGIGNQNKQITAAQFDSYRRGLRLYHNDTAIRLLDDSGNTVLESAYAWPSGTSYMFVVVLQITSDTPANWIYVPRPGKHLWHGEMLSTSAAVADVRNARKFFRSPRRNFYRL